eukprot:TRINITY_DN3856_c0_g2_i1.p1 TRINITY_DN3856_c0_g2~~TRINITY_DN3856_c0_g2_i1.p1  ORF type:complete len:343 (+),score=37.72 TRINITY_DN3856_c0_g2_i1:254-1282(+)
MALVLWIVVFCRIVFANAQHGNGGDECAGATQVTIPPAGTYANFHADTSLATTSTPVLDCGDGVSLCNDVWYQTQTVAAGTEVHLMLSGGYGAYAHWNGAMAVYSGCDGARLACTVFPRDVDGFDKGSAINITTPSASPLLIRVASRALDGFFCYPNTDLAGVVYFGSSCGNWPVTTDGLCGIQDTGYFNAETCAAGECCSQSGHCGSGSSYCTNTQTCFENITATTAATTGLSLTSGSPSTGTTATAPSATTSVNKTGVAAGVPGAINAVPPSAASATPDGRMIAGVVVGVVGGLALVLAAVLFLLHLKRRARKAAESQQDAASVDVAVVGLVQSSVGRGD